MVNDAECAVPEKPKLHCSDMIENGEDCIDAGPFNHAHVFAAICHVIPVDTTICEDDAEIEIWRYGWIIEFPALLIDTRVERDTRHG